MSKHIIKNMTLYRVLTEYKDVAYYIFRINNYYDSYTLDYRSDEDETDSVMKNRFKLWIDENYIWAKDKEESEFLVLKVLEEASSKYKEIISFSYIQEIEELFAI